MEFVEEFKQANPTKPSQATLERALQEAVKTKARTNARAEAARQVQEVKGNPRKPWQDSLRDLSRCYRVRSEMSCNRRKCSRLVLGALVGSRLRNYLHRIQAGT
jgi:hypothetical protein